MTGVQTCALPISTADEKCNAVADSVATIRGDSRRPILVGTRSIASSQQLAELTRSTFTAEVVSTEPERFDKEAAAAATDAQRVARNRPRVVQVVHLNLKLPRLAVDVDFDAFGVTGTIVGQRYLMPLVQGDGLLSLHADGFVEPLAGVVVLNFSVLENQFVAQRLFDVLHFADDRAGAGGAGDAIIR